MFRTIMALVIALVVAIVIGAFQILGLDIATLQAVLSGGDIVGFAQAQGALLFSELIFPYTWAMGGAYAPLVALGVAGFIAGLISKSGVRMLFVSLICLGLFFVGYWVLSLGLDATDVSAMAALAQSIAIDLGVSFALLFVPGIIGASLTAEEY
ncbi:MAG: hypothetical protein AM324_010020 [Candidatus Thorarchaeota archaeon SMTZ1-83]|nr:MAG: hypothetical protein AM324_11390 [Candidatus Thorarchaeota archaeon SMTZ1-83]